MTLAWAVATAAGAAVAAAAGGAWAAADSAGHEPSPRSAETPARVPASTATAPPAPHENSLVALAGVGFSRSLDPPVRNLGAPVFELRYARRLTRHLEPDVGLALIAFPEPVPELRAGVRFRPLAHAHIPIVSGLFLRPGAHALLAGGAGFEWALGAEVGYLADARRLLGYLALATTRVFRHPRVLFEARLGAGFRF